MAETKQTPQTLGEYIGQAIKEDGRIGDQIAAAVGIDSSYLSRIKSGQPPGTVVLEALIRELLLDPATAHRLAAKAADGRRAEKMRRRMDLIQKHLSRHSSEVPDIASIQQAVYRRLLQHKSQAAGSGIPVLVIDPHKKTASQVRLQVLKGPDLDEGGEVYVRLRTDQAESLPREFFLDVIFLFVVPTPACLRSVHISSRERHRLATDDGLEIHVRLPEGPGLEELLQGVAPSSREVGVIRRSLGLEGCLAFRIRAASAEKSEE